MANTEKLAEQIKACNTHNDLKTLWNNRKDVNGKDKWPKGKLMEYLVVRSFRWRQCRGICMDCREMPKKFSTSLTS